MAVHGAWELSVAHSLEEVYIRHESAAWVS